MDNHDMKSRLPGYIDGREVAVPRRRRADPVETLIGQRLKQLRLERGMTQVELAQEAGLHQSVLSECERGDVRLHGALVVRLAKALQVSTDALLGLEKAPTGPRRSGRLLRRLDRIEALPRTKQRVVLEMVDAFIDKHGRRDGQGA